MTALLVFAAGYTINLCYISVFFHRGLAHRAIRLRPRALRFVVATGSWMTGLDPKAWVAMHRRHHADSDGPGDPHSPHIVGVGGVFLAQLRAYERELFALLSNHPAALARVRDLDFAVSWCNRRGLWWLPYGLHAALAVALGLAAGPAIGIAWFAGLMSHPVQGWLVNAFGHASGGRTFDTADGSRNNLWVALLVFGEGLQNNHHHRPSAARFAVKWYEPDLGYALCRLFAWARLLDLDRQPRLRR